jgi:RNA polymerase sigma-70 factor (ECF subfamily)
MSVPLSNPVGPRHFATTRWSVVLAAADLRESTGRTALETLCRAYWLPVYDYVRRRGHNAIDAEDLTQEFFATLLDKQYLDSADPNRGRFRSFLLTMVNRFLSKQYEKDQAQKRGGGKRALSIDAEYGEERYRLQPASGKTPEQLFERQWALTVLDESLARLRESYFREGKTELFESLKPLLIPAAVAPLYAELGARAGLSEGAVKMAVQRLRQRYRDMLHQEIVATLDARDDLHDELNRLMSALRT